jgi:hypothetical protein
MAYTIRITTAHTTYCENQFDTIEEAKDFLKTYPVVEGTTYSIEEC